MLRHGAFLWLGLALCGCGSDAKTDQHSQGAEDAATPSGDAAPESAAAPVDFVPSETDFECISRWTKVRSFFITNKAGKLDEALAVANSPTGGRYPVGTFIQLVPFEAMVKRGAGFNAGTNDWEFFALSTSMQGTTIAARGTEDVVNQFGGNCFTCHQKADPAFDFVCESDHGCDPLPLTPAVIDTVQKSDQRCP